MGVNASSTIVYGVRASEIMTQKDIDNLTNWDIYEVNGTDYELFYHYADNGVNIDNVVIGIEIDSTHNIKTIDNLKEPISSTAKEKLIKNFNTEPQLILMVQCH